MYCPTACSTDNHFTNYRLLSKQYAMYTMWIAYALNKSRPVVQLHGQSRTVTSADVAAQRADRREALDLGVNFHRALSCGILFTDRFVYYQIELITQIKTCNVASEGNGVHGGGGGGVRTTRGRGGQSCLQQPNNVI